MPPGPTPARFVQRAEPRPAIPSCRRPDMSTANVTAIERLLDIFEAFQASQRPLSLTELAELSNLPKSTCHAIVGTLTARGYLYSLARPCSLYPTKRMFDVARAIVATYPFGERMTPFLRRFRDSSTLGYAQLGGTVCPNV